MMQAQIHRIRGLLQHRRFAEALAAASALEPRSPNDRDILFMIAVSQRSLEQFSAALATLAKLERHHPRFSRLYQEGGACHLALKDAPSAIEAYTRAVAINPALPASWKTLEFLHRSAGDRERASAALRQIAALDSMAPEILNATSLFEDGDSALAERLVRGQGAAGFVRGPG